MRTLMLIAPALLLTGCNLFKSGLIEQTCEDLPDGCGGIDTQPGDDTGDTAPWVPENPYSLGLVLGVKQGAQLALYAFDAERNGLLDAAIAVSQVDQPGPVAYDPEQPRLMLVDNGNQQLLVATEGGSFEPVPMQAVAVGEDAKVNGLLMVDSGLYLSTTTTVLAYQPGDSQVARLASPSGVSSIQGLFPAYEDNLFLLNWGQIDNQPDLYRFTISTTESRLSYEDFDDNLGRAVSGFVGPQAKPFVCSQLGGVYSVEDLQAGERGPAAFPDRDDLNDLIGVELLSGVSTCAWDDQAERYLVFSTEYGVFSMDAWGRVELLIAPGDDQGYFAAAFFTPVQASE